MKHDVFTPTIEREGQRFVDTPVQVRPRQTAAIIRTALGLPALGTYTVGYSRTYLRWLKAA